MKIFHSPHLILHKVYVDSNRAPFAADRLRKPHVASKERVAQGQATSPDNDSTCRLDRGTLRFAV